MSRVPLRQLESATVATANKNILGSLCTCMFLLEKVLDGNSHPLMIYCGCS